MLCALVVKPSTQSLNSITIIVTMFFRIKILKLLMLVDVLWAYKTSLVTATGETLYALMFGQEVVLPCEVDIKFVRVQYQNAMIQELRDMDEGRIDALNKLYKKKLKVSKTYNKKVKKREFIQRDLV
jgi:hypothetical protein